MRLLLVVEATFAIGRHGLVVVPDADLGPTGPRRIRVELRRPDGSAVVVDVMAELPFFNPPPPRRLHVLRFEGLGKEDVPIGTEVWSVDELE